MEDVLARHLASYRSDVNYDGFCINEITCPPDQRDNTISITH